MKEINRICIPTYQGQEVRSLYWRGDALIDLASGGVTYHLDSTAKPSSVFYGYRFDHAIGFKETGYAILYEALGTKGLILKNGKYVREINRSYYHADVYEYPVVIFEVPGGRVVIAHCPEEYDKIEIEEIESGKRLTTREGKPQDFFHSRLQVSADGEYLLSAGWAWQPWDLVQTFSLREALQNPKELDQSNRWEAGDDLFEIHAAAFQGNGRVIMAGNIGGESNKQSEFIARYNLHERSTELRVAVKEAPGTIMPVGDDHLLGFFAHPKLFEISTGKVIQRWPELQSGNHNSSIIHYLEKLPHLALDPAQNRFALANKKEITVIELG